MKPQKVLIFIVMVMAMLASIMLLFPKNGIKISDNLILYFPSFHDMFSPREKGIDIDSLLASQQHLNQLLPDDDSITALDIEELKKLVTPLEFPDDNPHALDAFFAKLVNIEAQHKLRILHYGDSQIEGDRITAFLRNRLQAKFGGKGMGLNTAGVLYSQLSMLQQDSGNWLRYQGFLGANEWVWHKKFGVMMAFSRFTYILDSAAQPTPAIKKAWLQFSRSDLGYANTKQFRNINIYYGNAKAKVSIVLSSDGNQLVADSLQSGEGLHVFTYRSPEYLENVRFDFEGTDSPDFYGISFEDDAGIYVDNIALRGSSGTMFTSTDANLLLQTYNHMGVDLFILQFGGNVMPYISDAKAAAQHANFFYYQMALLKRLVPDAGIIVIGPSDMSVKEKDYYMTYPILETVRDELKAATHKAGGVYWDMYKAMGGKNSMISWVNANPPLAAPDFVHFTPQGTNVAANMFYNAFILEYTSYCDRNKKTK